MKAWLWLLVLLLTTTGAFADSLPLLNLQDACALLRPSLRPNVARAPGLPSPPPTVLPTPEPAPIREAHVTQALDPAPLRGNFPRGGGRRGRSGGDN